MDNPLWPCDDRPGDYPPYLPRDPRTADLWTPRYTAGARLLAVRPCRWCGRDVRVADLHKPPAVQVDVEALPVPHEAVTNPDWLAFWWSDTWGLTHHYRHLGVEHHQAAGDLVFVLHPCARAAHRPGAAPPDLEPQPTKEPHMTFGTPGTPGEGASNDELSNKLLLITVTEKVVGMTTSAGVSDALRTEIAELDTGAEHSDNLLFGKVLVNQLKPGVTYLGFLGKGTAAPGKSAPWIFTGAETDPAAVEKANKYLAYKAGQAPAAAAPAPAAAPAAAPFPAATAGAAAAAPWAS